jgi:hypothetical protein
LAIRIENQYSTGSLKNLTEVCLGSLSVLLPFAALHWWRGPPARSVGVLADVLWHCAARRPEVAAAGEDARATNSN